VANTRYYEQFVRTQYLLPKPISDLLQSAPFAPASLEFSINSSADSAGGLLKHYEEEHGYSVVVAYIHLMASNAKAARTATP